MGQGMLGLFRTARLFSCYVPTEVHQVSLRIHFCSCFIQSGIQGHTQIWGPISSHLHHVWCRHYF